MDSMSLISPHHPRAESLRIREKIAAGFRRGIVVPEGLAAHGRGEAFDYLLGEKTTGPAKSAIRAAAALLLLARHPVISVNGNTAALVPGEVAELAEVTGSKVEINLFHRSAARVRKIARWLKAHGASDVLGTDREFYGRIPEIQSRRRIVDRRGIAAADVVLVPLEDGDRTEALRRLGKRVIAIDLNPLSRTAKKADITIVDNLVRAMPLLIKECRRLKNTAPHLLKKIVDEFDNERALHESLEIMLGRLTREGNPPAPT